jgi:hypothetical protein
MDQILRDIGNALSSVFSNEVVQLAFRGIGIYIVIIWLATAFWAYQDMKHRSANPILPYLAAALIVIFTPILFIFAAILYRIIRPHERIGEAHERMLAEEAMLAEVEQIDHCAGCGRRIDEAWIVCPTCRTRLKRVCPNCGKLVGTEWALCAWCGADFEPAVRPAAVGAGPYAPSLAPRPTSRPAPGPAARPAPVPTVRPMTSPPPAPAPFSSASSATPERSQYEPEPDAFVGSSPEPATSRVAPMARPVRAVAPASAATVSPASSVDSMPDPTDMAIAPTPSQVEPFATAPSPSAVEPAAPAPRRRASTR